MDANQLPPLTPDQLHALAAGHGVAEFVDPTTNRVYVVSESGGTMALDDAYIKQKLDEARADAKAGRFTEGFDVESFLAEARERRGARS
ncbi:hypothetical protein KOR34_28510 [Posidoniimonas corsicana]|uniref:Uncharacterized protein n=1 Tax=Posidoniimonas corsicana TaxID=1938618 RepID=A0A5C5VJA4_9BACT|nr:hypothetical protein [Posidoniimonas corsicana]TWT37885.1 hypothetical protein KOR34_28510 [Posidoniimonas corsicana]